LLFKTFIFLSIVSTGGISNFLAFYVSDDEDLGAAVEFLEAAGYQDEGMIETLPGDLGRFGYHKAGDSDEFIVRCLLLEKHKSRIDLDSDKTKAEENNKKIR